ncbi:sugar transferase [Patescibacteria group bacterium]|nr:sugar transferase [Patescibacteria group bacterium]
MKPSEIILGLLKIPVDFIMGILAFVVAYHLRTVSDLIPGIKLPLDLTLFPPLQDYINFSAITLLVLLIMLAAGRMYSLKNHTKLSREIGKIIFTAIIWGMLIIAYFFIIREFPFSRLALAYSWLLTVIFISIGRAIIRMIENALLKANIGKRNLLFIGNNVVTETLYERMKKDPKYRIVGLLGMHTNGSIRNLGSIDNLADIVKKYKVEEILQTTSGLSKTQAEDILEFCRENHLAYSFVPDLLAMHKTNVEIRTQSGIPIIKMKPTPLDGWGRVIKRGFDTLGALVGLILLSPIFLLTAIAIKLDSKGNIFFKYLDDGSRVKRVGQHGKLFNFYKFRTMHPGTHNLRYTRLAEKNARKGSPLVKIKDDPRITRTGRFLRKTSIDELPQLVNVLKGEMSLVGPRPHLPEEVAKYAVHHKFVLTIKPGITGLAQISGRSDLDFEEEMRLDTYYIENWSLWMDIVILFKTFGVFFKGYRE